MDRIDYSNDTATALVRGPLSVDRRQFAATGNADFGYFAGGVPGPLSSVDRIDYSNDTATAAAKGPLSFARYDLAATGNKSFGYFAGSWINFWRIDRIDYSNDTATASQRGELNMGSPTEVLGLQQQEILTSVTLVVLIQIDQV